MGVAEQEELLLLVGQRGARMAEMQVPHEEFSAMKDLKVEARGLEHDENR